MTLSDADRTKYQARLSEAEDALHKLTIGGQSSLVRYGDQELRKTPGNITMLKAYVADLERKLGIGARRGSGFIRIVN